MSIAIDFKCGKLNCAINPSVSQIVFRFTRRVWLTRLYCMDFFFYLFLSSKINLRYSLICFKLICHHIQTCKTCLIWGTPTFYSLPVTHDLCFYGSVSQSLVTVFHFVDKIWILSLRLKPHEWYVPQSVVGDFTYFFILTLHHWRINTFTSVLPPFSECNFNGKIDSK